MGYQCQSCAKLVTFDSEPVGEVGLESLERKVKKVRCACGGSYGRDKAIICPLCRSKNVGYEVRYLT